MFRLPTSSLNNKGTTTYCLPITTIGYNCPQTEVIEHTLASHNLLRHQRH